jgi:hypothetical protein
MVVHSARISAWLTLGTVVRQIVGLIFGEGKAPGEIEIVGIRQKD